MRPDQVPGLITEEEGKWLAENAAEGAALEIGSFRGRSTCYLASTARYVIACEPFSGQPRPPRAGCPWLDFAEVRRSWLQNIAESRIEDRVRLVERRSAEAYADLLAEFESTLDLVFVDGSHYVPDLLTDVCFTNLLRVGGVIAFHDYGNPDFPDVTETVDRWFASVTRDFEEVIAPENMRAFRKACPCFLPRTWFEVQPLDG